MMSAVSAAARAIAWTSDEVWERVDSSLKGPLGWRMSRDRDLAPGVVLRDGRVCITAAADPADDRLLVLRVAVAAAQADARIDRTTLDRLATESPDLAIPWGQETRDLFADLLLTGRPAIDVIETLDQRGLWVRILPEWEPVRSKPQRNAYHRFTVDRHLCETAANASALVDRVDRPDLLVVGALLHDIGKGYPGDHIDGRHRRRLPHRSADGLRGRRHRAAHRDGARSPAAARRGHPPRPLRRGHDPLGRVAGRDDAFARSCWTR